MNEAELVPALERLRNERAGASISGFLEVSHADYAETTNLGRTCSRSIVPLSSINLDQFRARTGVRNATLPFFLNIVIAEALGTMGFRIPEILNYANNRFTIDDHRIAAWTAAPFVASPTARPVDAFWLWWTEHVTKPATPFTRLRDIITPEEPTPHSMRPTIAIDAATFGMSFNIAGWALDKPGGPGVRGRLLVGTQESELALFFEENRFSESFLGQLVGSIHESIDHHCSNR